MAIVEYTQDENVAIITMNNGDNRFNPSFLEAYIDVLDEVEKNTEACTLVVRSSHEKIFSNGIDTDWLVPLIEKQEIDTVKDFFCMLNKLFKRIVTYPMITIAAITGHAFAAGAIMACAFDFRFMRSDRGFFCLPEVDVGFPFLQGMNALLKKAIPLYKLEEMEYTGIRLTARECQEHNIIKKACHIDDLMDETVRFAKSLNKNRTMIDTMKSRLNREIIHAIDVDDVPIIESGKFKIT